MSDDPEDTLLSQAQVLAFLGKGRSTLFRWSKDPAIEFPAPDTVMSKQNFWKRRTISAFINRINQTKNIS